MRHLVVVGVVLALAGTANAQQPTDDFGIERFRIGIDREALLDVDWADVPAHGNWSASAFVGFAHEPLVIYRDGTPIEALVDGRLASGLVGSVALWKRLQLGIGLDFVGYQSGSDTLMELPSSGLGDARLVAKVLAYRADRVAVSIIPVLTVPGGSAGGYLRESGPTFAPMIAVSGAGERLRLGANVGYRMRERTRTAGLIVNDEVFARAAAGVRAGARAELSLSLSFAAPPTDRSANRLAVETMLGGTVRVSRSLDVFAAGGAGLDNGFGTPDWRAVAGVRFASAKQEPVPLAPPVPPIVIRDPEPPKEPTPPPPETGTLSGHVVDAEGLPIERVRIRITHAGEAIDVVTDADGMFRTPVQVGDAEVTTDADEYEPARATAQIILNKTATVEIKLARKVRQGQLRGQVLSFGGKALEATVIVSAGGKEVARATADKDGQFSIELPAGSFEVTIEAAGHVTQKRTIKVKLDGVTVLNLDMRGGK